MAQGLPKKYAKMGFKKGWAAYKAQQRKTAAKRKNPPKPKSKPSSKHSTKASNPSGGARTSKIGATFKKIKALFNITAAAQGSATDDTLVGSDMKLRNVLARYTGVQIPDLGGKTFFNIDYCLETWKGIATEIGVQWFDGKTRHFGNISKTKLLDIAEELLPVVMAHEDSKDSPTYLTSFARQYHKYTQGYDMHDGRWGGWNFDYMKPYATIKAVRAVANKLGITRKINTYLPKGVNL